MFERLKIIALICIAMITVHVIDLFLGGYLKSYGVEPRELDSIYTIFTAPWLHMNITHLFNNLLVFIVLSFLCLLQGARYFFKASAIIILLSGLLLWSFGRDANHIGASGWIFGLWSLTVAIAWFERSFKNIVISISVMLYYGSIIFIGILPIQQGVSFEGHIFGIIAGISAAAILSRNKIQISKPDTGIKFWQ